MIYKRCNPRRKLTDEETRIYAAGMAARKRGETKPTTELPFNLHQIWKMGWNRSGHRLRISSMYHDTNTIKNGIHMVRTEVENFDVALSVIEARQRRTKGKATIAKSGYKMPWQTELRLAQVRAPRAAKMKEKAARRKENIADMEKRHTDRISKAISMLCFSVEEISSLAGTDYSNNFYSEVTTAGLINVIRALSKMIKKPVPTFDIVRKPGQTKTIKRCVNCGATTDNDLCSHCAELHDVMHATSESRRELERDTRDIKQLIRKTEGALHGYNKGHGRHPRQDTSSVEAGGRKEDFDLGSAAAYRTSEDDPGDVEG